tara:strand:+ start:623 stop:814 length:192 start_codon:yes stop_codon:yes gene_type:complete
MHTPNALYVAVIEPYYAACVLYTLIVDHRHQVPPSETPSDSDHTAGKQTRATTKRPHGAVIYN